jgi:hypothetical protein
LAKRISPLKAIRLMCLECSVGYIIVVKNCVKEDCPLFPYRLGTDPKRKGIGNIDNFSKNRIPGIQMAKKP